MSSTGWRFTEHFEAGEDMSGLRHTVVRMSAADTIRQASDAAGVFNVGILEDKPKLGRQGRVTLFGKTKAISGAAVTAPQLVASNGSGRVIAATSGDTVIGMAKTSSAADGEFVTVLMGGPIGPSKAS